YFFLYILVSNLLTDKKQLKAFLWAGVVTALIVGVFAYAHIGKVTRLYAPFDESIGAGTGESATLGGYLLIILCLSMTFFTQIPHLHAAFAGLALFVFLLPPFVLTLSRASYVGLFAGLLTIVFFTRRRKILLLSLLAVAAAGAPIVSPGLYGAAQRRLQETFLTPASHLQVSGWNVGLETSAAQRINSWRYAFSLWLPKHPLLGHGVTGVGLVDAQYPLILGETGVLGFVAFGWLLWTLLKHTHRIYRRSQSGLDRGLSLGLLAACAGLCTQAFTTNTFIIVRIMEPFWFLAAVVMRLPSLSEPSVPATEPAGPPSLVPVGRP
ncbi:MAG TPA: O-antigen ligase family protein, partial [Elusimicrobiota bacterium]|nr:O-antigen ligase family protein [Elusimicrobiota bacterium]